MKIVIHRGRDSDDAIKGLIDRRINYILDLLEDMNAHELKSLKENYFVYYVDEKNVKQP